MPPTQRDDLVVLVTELAAATRGSLDLAAGRCDRIETAAEALRSDVVTRSHEHRDLLQAHDIRLTRIETRGGMLGALGSGIAAGVVSLAVSLAAWAMTR